MERFTPWPNVSGKYGASMGRTCDRIDLEGIPDSQIAVAGPAGEYDAGGAYWGYDVTNGPVWAVWIKGKGRDGVAYVRARGRAGAISKARNLMNAWAA